MKYDFHIILWSVLFHIFVICLKLGDVVQNTLADAGILLVFVFETCIDSLFLQKCNKKPWFRYVLAWVLSRLPQAEDSLLPRVH